MLVHVLKDRNVSSGIVFTSRKRTVSQITRVLNKAGIHCERISSDSDQSEREEVMLGFRQRKFPILVATDVVSRGIDIDNIELVVNYDVPPNEEDYVHRIGRTARANRDGEGVTLVNPDDQQRFGRIERLIERTIPKLEIPSNLGPGPEYQPHRSHRGGGNRNRGNGGGNKPRRGGSANQGKPHGNRNHVGGGGGKRRFGGKPKGGTSANVPRSN